MCEKPPSMARACNRDRNHCDGRQRVRARWYLLLLLALIAFAVCSGCTVSVPGRGDQGPATSPGQVAAGPAPGTLPGSYVAPDGWLTVRFLDVGLGDAILVESPSGKAVLIDAGPGLMNGSLVSALDAAGLTGLDVVISTHPHEDHIGGMKTVLNRYPVGRFIDTGMPHTTATYQALVKQIAVKQIPYQHVQAGDTISIEPGVVFLVLNPDGSLRSSDDNENIAENLNENSLVLSLSYGNVTFLFMGDATTEAEQYMLSKGVSLDADILKVAHHGSSRSSGSRFLEQVSPSVSIIEVGSGNPYGYPASATLQRLQKAGSAVYRTDLNGTIVITTDGSAFRILLEHGAPASVTLPVTARAST